MGNRKISRYLATVICSAFILMTAAAGAQTVTVPATLVGYPDLVIHNAMIATMDDPSLNPTMGRTAEAMAVREGKILAAGKQPGDAGAGRPPNPEDRPQGPDRHTRHY